MVSIVYMVAGLSSRFGGKIKQFAKVGINGETLMEVSLEQAKRAGFENIIFIVGKMTELPFKEKFGNNYKGIPIAYAVQEFDASTRDRPWGSTDALVSAKNVIFEDFVVCNGDDLYGDKAMKQIQSFLSDKKNKDLCVSLGYKLEKVLPIEGQTNRGIFTTNKNGEIIKIEEHIGVSRQNLSEKGLKKSDLCSMNFFGLRKDAVNLLEEKLKYFKEGHALDRKAECYLPVELGKLINKNKIKMTLIPTEDTWFGVTNPADEETVREDLKRYYSKSK